jgi:hypothetical protein
MGRIYEVRHYDWLRWHDVYTKFCKDWFRLSRVDRGCTQTYRQQGDFINILTKKLRGRQTHMDTKTDRRKSNLISVLLFFKIKKKAKKVMLKQSGFLFIFERWGLRISVGTPTAWTSVVLHSTSTLISGWYLKLGHDRFLHHFPIYYLLIVYRSTVGERVVGWGTMLQGEGSRVRFSIRLLDFLIDVILPAAPWASGRLRL